MKTHLFIDLSSMQHLIANVEGHSGRRPLSLQNLIANLERRGLDVCEVGVALVANAVLVDDESDLELALAGIARDARWLKKQERLLGRSIKVLPGGFDGRHELGVDEVLVGGVVVRSHDIAVRGAIDEEIVVVMTNDSDMNHLAGYALPTRVVLCGYYVDEEGNHTRRQLVGARVPFIDLTSDEVRSLDASQPDPVPDEPVHLGDHFNVQPYPVAKPLGGSTVALVDAYGISCTAALALGISHLPTTASARSVLEHYGYPPHARLMLSVPDLRWSQMTTAKLGVRAEEAWTARDVELDSLAREASSEPKWLTRVNRGVLRPDFQRDGDLHALRRDNVLRMAKRNTTVMAAELTRLVLRRPNAQVVVVSDEPPLVHFQSVLGEIVGENLRYLKIVRMGAVPVPVRLVDDVAERRAPGDYIVLTQGDLAQLVQVTDHAHGRALSSELVSSLDSDDETHWKVISFDAETDGLLVESTEHPDFEIVLANGATAFPGASKGIEIVLQPHQVSLEFEPHLPVGVPTAVLSGSRSGITFTPYRSVDVVGRDGDRVLGDVDGDGEEDVEIQVLADVAPFTKGEHLTLGMLHGADPRWVYVTTTSIDVAEQVVQVVCEIQSHEETVFAVELDPGSARRGPLAVLDGVALSEYQDGDVFFAVNIAEAGDPVSWLATSSALRPEAWPNPDPSTATTD